MRAGPRAGSRFVARAEERLLAVVHALLHRCYKMPFSNNAEVHPSLRKELGGATAATSSLLCATERSAGGPLARNAAAARRQSASGPCAAQPAPSVSPQRVRLPAEERRPIAEGMAPHSCLLDQRPPRSCAHALAGARPRRRARGGRARAQACARRASAARPAGRGARWPSAARRSSRTWTPRRRASRPRWARWPGGSRPGARCCRPPARTACRPACACRTRAACCRRAPGRCPQARLALVQCPRRPVRHVEGAPCGDPTC
jgi:hypothetical protein